MDWALSEFESGLQTIPGQGMNVAIEGFLSPELINHFVLAVQQFVDTGAIPWGVIRVSGFEDSPVSFFNRAHSVLLRNGDNDYSLLILPSQVKSNWFYITLGPKDGFS
jgi:hypothetical protein